MLLYQLMDLLRREEALFLTLFVDQEVGVVVAEIVLQNIEYKNRDFSRFD